MLALGDWLAGLGVPRVVMEATSDYWRAPFYLLEDRFQTWLVNAHDVKHVPGRPKTDRLDAVWLCKVGAPIARLAWSSDQGVNSTGGSPTARHRARTTAEIIELNELGD